MVLLPHRALACDYCRHVARLATLKARRYSSGDPLEATTLSIARKKGLRAKLSAGRRRLESSLIWSRATRWSTSAHDATNIGKFRNPRFCS